jgi:acyl dehydratase
MTAQAPLRLDTLRVGDEMASLSLPPVSRTTLALFAGASGDHNPIHLDSDFAKRAGMPDVFAQGMLVMAWVGRLLTDTVPQHLIRRFDVRFIGITHVGDALKCSARVVERVVWNDIPCIRLELKSVNQHGENKLSGEALIELNWKSSDPET